MWVVAYSPVLPCICPGAWVARLRGREARGAVGLRGSLLYPCAELSRLPNQVEIQRGPKRQSQPSSPSPRVQSSLWLEWIA